MGSTGMANGFPSYSGAGASNINSQSVYTPVMDFIDEGSIVDLWLSRSPERMHRVFRRIYLEDPVAGPAVELYKDMPWSEFSLVGVQDPEILRFYLDALNAINATQLLPDITKEFLVMGKVIGHMLMDEQKGYFTRVIIHDPDHIRVNPSPIPGFPPKLDILPSPSLRQVMFSEDVRDQAVQQQLRQFSDLIRENKEIPLHPANSFYLPRSTAPYDSIGASVYTRILHLVAYEKALINSTLATANRRISRIRHVVVGEENWEPNEEEMTAYADLFMEAEKDPVGALVATRTGVTVNEVGGNTLSDIIKMSDEWEFLSKAKLNSLGVSETFMTGEATYNSIEQVVSVFLERVRAHRNFVTYRFLIDQILKPLAKKHQFIRRTKASLDHRIRVAAGDDRTDYILPTIRYEKSLRPSGDKDYMDFLSTLEDKGIPITLRTWAATAGFDLQTEIDQMEDDRQLRQAFQKHKDLIEAGGAEAPSEGGGAESLFGEEGGGGGGSDESGGGEEAPAEEESGAEAFELGASASFRDAAMNAIDKLPHFKDDVFMGVTRRELRDRAMRVIQYLGGRKSKPLPPEDNMRLLSVGHPQRTLVVGYLLARAGLLSRVSLPESVAKDMIPALCANLRDAKALSDEILAVQTMVQVKETAKSPKMAHRFKNVGIRGDTGGKLLLTGYTDDARVTKDT